MPATSIAAPTKYTDRGTTDYVWMTTCANYLSPTRAEINGGTSLKLVVADAAGWSMSSAQTKTPNLADRFTTSIPGPVDADDSTLTVYSSKTGTDAGTLTPQDAAGFMAVMHGGDVAGQKMDIWPVTVASVSRAMAIKGDAANMKIITYSPSSVPAMNVTIPA
jgi:hypothetical protein